MANEDRAALLKMMEEHPEIKVMPMDMADLVWKMDHSVINLIMWYQHKSPRDLAEHPELAIQIGVAMSLGKPIILMVKDGDTAPESLIRASDAVLTGVNYDDKNSWQPQLEVLMSEAMEKTYGPRSAPGTAGEVRPTDNADEGEPR